MFHVVMDKNFVGFLNLEYLVTGLVDFGCLLWEGLFLDHFLVFV